MLLLLALHVLLEVFSLVQNPFGAAKPRETVLAAKLGKKEEDILKEELSKDRINVRYYFSTQSYLVIRLPQHQVRAFVQLRLDPEQNDQKRAAEEAVKEVEDELEAETDESKLEALKAEVAGRKEKLSTLIDGFQVSCSWWHAQHPGSSQSSLLRCRKWPWRRLRLGAACVPQNDVPSRCCSRALVAMVTSPTGVVPMKDVVAGVADTVVTTATLVPGLNPQQAAIKQRRSTGIILLLLHSHVHLPCLKTKIGHV